jgi:hypothetical protein
MPISLAENGPRANAHVKGGGSTDILDHNAQRKNFVASAAFLHVYDTIKSLFLTEYDRLWIGGRLRDDALQFHPRPLLRLHLMHRLERGVPLIGRIPSGNDYGGNANGSRDPERIYLASPPFALPLLIGFALLFGAATLLNRTIDLSDRISDASIFGGAIPFIVGLLLILSALFPGLLWP